MLDGSYRFNIKSEHWGPLSNQREFLTIKDIAWELVNGGILEAGQVDECADALGKAYPEFFLPRMGTDSDGLSYELYVLDGEQAPMVLVDIPEECMSEALVQAQVVEPDVPGWLAPAASASGVLSLVVIASIVHRVW